MKAYQNPLPVEILDSVAAPAGSALPLPRALLVFAHPDDEVLAVGARMERFATSRFLCITDGAPRDGEDARAQGFATLEGYKNARRAELEAALREAGVPLACAASLHLGSGDAIADKEAAMHLPALTRALVHEIAAFEPEAILTHPYEGGHPDHDSCAFAVHAAVKLRGEALPIVEATFYHASETGMATDEFLSRKGAGLAVARELSPEESKRKQTRLDCFRSQRAILANFEVKRELYRLAPAYDFTAPPHPGRLLYEHWGWDIDGARFRALAEKALRELGLA